MADVAKRLIDWFRENRRELPWRRTRDIYRVWVSEVMLQQTQTATVIPFFERFLVRFPDVAALAAAVGEDVLKAWEGLGYYARARNLHQAAQLVIKHHGGKIPSNLDAFRRLPGVGDYIAAAVLSIAAGLPLPVVDGNVLRVCTRWWGVRDDIRRLSTKKEIRARLAKIIPKGDRPGLTPGDFNEALMELGATICLPRRPLCEDCPLRSRCRARLNDQTGVLPLKGKKKAVPVVAYTALIIQRGDGRVAIRQRPPLGLLGGLWGLPNAPLPADETPEKSVLRLFREIAPSIKVKVHPLGQISHAYTHFKVRLQLYWAKLTKEPPDVGEWRWLSIAGLQEFPLGGIDRKCIAQFVNIDTQ